MKSQIANRQIYNFNGFGNYDSRWMLVAALALALFMFAGKGHAQIASSNPLEYVALAEGNELINAQIKNQITDPAGCTGQCAEETLFLRGRKEYGKGCSC